MLDIYGNIQLTKYTEGDVIKIGETDLSMKHIIDEQFYNEYMAQFEAFQEWSDNPEEQRWKSIHKIVGYIDQESDNCFLVVSEEFKYEMWENKLFLLNITTDGNSISTIQLSEKSSYPGAHKTIYSEIGKNKIDSYEIFEGILDQDKEDQTRYLYHYDSISKIYELNNKVELIKTDTLNKKYWK
jgi:hypothetical protein